MSRNYLTSLALSLSLLGVKTYGEQLKALRLALGLSQEAMAEKLGYKRQGNLSLYENDKKRPTIATVLRHARACDQLPSQFLREVTVTEYDRVRAGAYDQLETLVRKTEQMNAMKDRAAASPSEKKPKGKKVAKG